MTEPAHKTRASGLFWLKKRPDALAGLSSSQLTRELVECERQLDAIEKRMKPFIVGERQRLFETAGGIAVTFVGFNIGGPLGLALGLLFVAIIEAAHLLNYIHRKEDESLAQEITLYKQIIRLEVEKRFANRSGKD